MLTRLANLQKSFEEFFKNARKSLIQGNFYETELKLQELLSSCHDMLMSSLLNEIGTSEELKVPLQKLGQSRGLGKFRERETKIQLCTGTWVRYRSFYAQGVSRQHEGTRHMSHLYWNCYEKASPLYGSRVSLLSVMCPSFEVASQVMNQVQIDGNYSRMRKISLAWGGQLQKRGARALLARGETLKGKRVAVLMDGGRSRTRCYTGNYNEKGQAEFETPWCEPRLIVIQVLDEKGNVDKEHSLPLYWVDIQKADEHFENLKELLISLKINEAQEVQFLADGAKFIWHRIRQTFIDCGVSPRKLTKTLDYYHAAEHLHELVKMLPGKKQEKSTLLLQLKDNLWNGLINSLERGVKNYLRQKEMTVSEKIENSLDYFIRHYDHMQYAKFKRKKLLCGSGIVESAIRRIINLRFKSASSFWLKENLETLIPLRCAFLAGRWDYLIHSLIAS